MYVVVVFYHLYSNYYLVVTQPVALGSLAALISVKHVKSIPIPFYKFVYTESEYIHNLLSITFRSKLTQICINLHI